MAELLDLYQPADPSEIMDFSRRLKKVGEHLSGGFTEGHGAELEVRVYFNEDDAARLCYSYDADDDWDNYTLSLSRIMPIDGSWDQGMASELLGLDKDDVSEVEEDAQSQGSLGLVQPLLDEGAEAQGYLEHETKIDLRRCGRILQVTKTVLFNALDQHFGLIEPIPVVDLLLVDILQAAHLEQLVNSGDMMLDTTTDEEALTMPSRADLILCTRALVLAGQLSGRTLAFRGAGRYQDIPLPSFYI